MWSPLNVFSRAPNRPLLALDESSSPGHLSDLARTPFPRQRVEGDIQWNTQSAFEFVNTLSHAHTHTHKTHPSFLYTPACKDIFFTLQ